VIPQVSQPQHGAFSSNAIAQGANFPAFSMGTKHYAVVSGSDSTVPESAFKELANRYDPRDIDNFMQAQGSWNVAQQGAAVRRTNASMFVACKSVASNGFQYAGHIDQTQVTSNMAHRIALPPGRSQGTQHRALTLDDYVAQGTPDGNFLATVLNNNVPVNNVELFVPPFGIQDQEAIATLASNAVEIDQSTLLAQMALLGCSAELTAGYNDMTCAQNIAPIASKQVNALGLSFDRSQYQPSFPSGGTAASANMQSSATVAAISFPTPDSRSHIVYSSSNGDSPQHTRATMMDPSTRQGCRLSGALDDLLVFDDEAEPFDGFTALEAIAKFERQYASSSTTEPIACRSDGPSRLQGWNEGAAQTSSTAGTEEPVLSIPCCARKKTVSPKKVRSPKKSRSPRRSVSPKKTPSSKLLAPYAENIDPPVKAFMGIPDNIAHLEKLAEDIPVPEGLKRPNYCRCKLSYLSRLDSD
jgi:hypothetical protein